MLHELASTIRRRPVRDELDEGAHFAESLHAQRFARSSWAPRRAPARPGRYGRLEPRCADDADSIGAPGDIAELLQLDQDDAVDAAGNVVRNGLPIEQILHVTRCAAVQPA